MLSFATVFPVLALIASLPKCVGSAMDVSQPRRTYAPLSDAGVAHPSPTPMVDFGGVDMELARRADGFTLGFGTCGYYYDDSPYRCRGSVMQCATSGRYMGCCSGVNCAVTRNNYYTACLDATAPACLSSTWGAYTVCCMSLEYPFCVTVLSTPSGSTLTGFVCGNNVFRGTQYITETPQFALATLTTSTPTPSPTSSSTTTTTIAPTPTPVESQAPVGAIVGGAIGGFAVLALIGFAIFFIIIRAKRRNHAPQREEIPQPSVAEKAQYASNPQSPSLPGYDFRSSMANAPQPQPYVHHQPAPASGASSPQLGQHSYAGTSDRLPSPTSAMQMQHPTAGAGYHLQPQEGAMYVAPGNVPPGPQYGAAGYPGPGAGVDPDARELRG